MNLTDVKIMGRNWRAYALGNPVLRGAGLVLDRLLRLRPTLCSEIYLVGRKGS